MVYFLFSRLKDDTLKQLRQTHILEIYPFTIQLKK